ncbi:fibronectin type III domain-containing protein [Pontiellaceae bacterium B12227]|nr:fibronectin type III domain-containing protein [Pontiellaceae bacterium B12227]
MYKKYIGITLIAGLCSAQTASAQYFTNNLTDAVSAAAEFYENLGPDGAFSYSATVASNFTTAGATLGLGVGVSNDTDNARSYLATDFSAYTNGAWKAHITIERPTAENNFVFFGLGNGQPRAANDYQPRSGTNMYLQIVFGNGSNSPRIFKNTTPGTITKIAQGSENVIGAGVDIWMSYQPVTEELTFEVDHWEDAEGINTTLSASIAGMGFNTNNANIFFGGNATTVFSDFYVEEVSSDAPPGIPDGLYSTISNMAVRLDWDESSGLVDAYVVKRSQESGAGYIALDTVTENSYVDTGVESNKTYYYVVCATNQYGESESIEVTGVGLPYDIIGTDTTFGNNPALAKDNLFDGDITTYFDATGVPGHAGLDFGDGNEQKVRQITYVLRNWNPYAYRNATNATFEGSDDPTFATGVEVLHTVPTTVQTYPSVNAVTITNTSTFRYVRLQSRSDKPLNHFAEIAFLTDADFTSNDTPKYWLDEYELVTGGDYEAADLEDSDGDGHAAWKEYVASTIPTDSNDVLRVTSYMNTTNGVIITWQSVEGKNYSVVTNASLTDPNRGAAMSGIIGLDGETSVTSSVPTEANLFMEIGVE